MRKKNSVRAKREGNKKPLTEMDRRDSAGLKRAIERANVGLTGHDRFGPSKIARFAAALGGSKYPQQWSGYINGNEHIPIVDKLITCLCFPDYAPQHLFPSWPFSTITPVAKSRIPILVYILAAISRESPEQQDLLAALIQAFRAASRPQRQILMRNARRLLTPRP